MLMRKQGTLLPSLLPAADEGSYVVNLGHNQYIHIKDKNTNTTR